MLHHFVKSVFVNVSLIISDLSVQLLYRLLHAIMLATPSNTYELCMINSECDQPDIHEYIFHIIYDTQFPTMLIQCLRDTHAIVKTPLLICLFFLGSYGYLTEYL